MANDIDCPRVIIVPCIQTDPSKPPCAHMLYGSIYADGAWQIRVWCQRWRENNDKSRVLNACDPDFKVKGENHGTETDK